MGWLRLGPQLFRDWRLAKQCQRHAAAWTPARSNRNFLRRKLRIMKLPVIDCIHYSDCGVTKGGCCGIKVDGHAKHSWGSCLRCAVRVPLTEEQRTRRLEEVEYIREVEPAPYTPAEAKRAATPNDYLALWTALHTHQPSPDTPKWLANFAAKLPCGDCRQHWIAWTTANPPPLDSAESFFVWAVQAHNAVNLRLNKPEVSVGDAVARWR